MDKDFARKMESLCGRKSRWEIWKDMIWLFATCISNAVDARNREVREKQYMAIAGQYSEKEMEIFAELFALMVQEMERGKCDYLGGLYMELGLGNDAGGQFFTPYDVCRMMARISLEHAGEMILREGWISVNDPACGAGATMIAAADELQNDLGINYQEDVLFAGQDIDCTTGLMCYIQMSLYGMAGYVHIGNTLTSPMTGHPLFGDGGEDTWYTPMYFTRAWEVRRKAEAMRRALGALEEGKQDGCLLHGCADIGRDDHPQGV